MKMNIFLIASIFAALSCSPTEPVTQQPQEPADPEPQPSERVLLAPGSLACSMTDAGLLLTWEDNSNREEGYIVVRQVGDGEPENIFIDANSTSYTDTGVDKGHYVYFGIECDSQVVKPLSREFQLSSLVLKFLFINPENK